MLNRSKYRTMVKAWTFDRMFCSIHHALEHTLVRVHVISHLPRPWLVVVPQYYYVKRLYKPLQLPLYTAKIRLYKPLP